MSKRNQEAVASASTAVAEEAAVAPPGDALAGVEFRSPLLQLAKTVIGPFLRHGPDCTAEACPCGLSAAITSLRDREILIQRYGVVDA